MEEKGLDEDKMKGNLKQKEFNICNMKGDLFRLRGQKMGKVELRISRIGRSYRINELKQGIKEV